MNDASPSFSYVRPKGAASSKHRASPPRSVLGAIAYFGALALILIAAIPHGTFEPWLKGALVVAISVTGVFRVADGLVRGGYRIAEPTLLLPMAGIVALAGLQLVPIFSGLPTSVDPYETQSFILVFSGLIIFGEILFYYTRDDRRLAQLVAVVLIATISSCVLGLLRHFVLRGEFDVFATNLQTEQSYAQFINRNHFALLVEMGLGLVVGILLKAQLRTSIRVAGWLATAFLVYSIIVANSRGGLMSLSGMAFFTVLILVMTRSSGVTRRDGNRRSSRRGTSIVFTKIATALGLCLISFFIIVALVVFVGGDPVLTRLEVFDRELVAEETRVNRAAIWEATIEMVKERPLFGSGFGAYATAITKFDPTNGRFYLQQAHNDYLEILANGGIVAALLFAACAVLVGRRMIQNLRALDPARQACCLGATVGVFGVLIHSVVDFGLHVLVNALVLIALIVIGTAAIDNQRT